METAELIRRAIHCDNTGQPNMAMLYMARARETNLEDRREIARRRMQLAAVEAARPVLKALLQVVEEAMPSIQAAMKSLGSAAEDAGKAWREAFPKQGPEVIVNPHVKQMFARYRNMDIRPKGWLSDGNPVF